MRTERMMIAAGTAGGLFAFLAAMVAFTGWLLALPGSMGWQ